MLFSGHYVWIFVLHADTFDGPQRLLISACIVGHFGILHWSDQNRGKHAILSVHHNPAGNTQEHTVLYRTLCKKISQNYNKMPKYKRP
jgi:hypothetical protein